MHSTTALHLARARQQELLRQAERRPRREPEAQPADTPNRRDDAPRWFRFPRLAGSRA
jgi:hypothetical protein